MKKLALLLGASALLLSVQAAQATSIITNGSFESGPDLTGLNPNYTQLSGGDNTSLPGWSVGGNSVDYIGSYWQASDGTHSVDLSGSNPGSLSQSFSTTIGQVYKVTFDLAGNPDNTGKPLTYDMSVGVTNSSLVGDQHFTFLEDTQTAANMGWAAQTLFFTAISSGLTTLTFKSNADGPWGPALDNVSVSQTPIPAALPLFATALGGLAFAARRRRRIAA